MRDVTERVRDVRSHASPLHDYYYCSGRRCLCLQPPVMVVIVIIVFSTRQGYFVLVKSLKFAQLPQLVSSFFLSILFRDVFSLLLLLVFRLFWLVFLVFGFRCSSAPE